MVKGVMDDIHDRRKAQGGGIQMMVYGRILWLICSTAAVAWAVTYFLR